jgi:hypothetical protein
LQEDQLQRSEEDVQKHIFAAADAHLQHHGVQGNGSGHGQAGVGLTGVHRGQFFFKKKG